MKTNKTARNEENRKMIAGVKKHFATAASIPVDGVPTPPGDVEKTLQAPIDLADATGAAGTAFHNAVAAEKAAATKAKTLYKGLAKYLLSIFANAPETLGDFGLAVPQERTLTAAEKAAAAQRRKQTRALRHTLGSRQKAAIKAPAAPVATAPGVGNAPTAPEAPATHDAAPPATTTNKSS